MWNWCAANNVFEFIHHALRSTPLLAALGYRDTKLLLVQQVAKGYYIQNRQFFRCVARALLIEFHRVTQEKTGRQFDIQSDWSEWSAWFIKTAETRETLKWHWAILTRMILPVLGMLAAVSGRCGDGLPTDAENVALEAATLKILCACWFAFNKTTYLAITTQYLITLRRLYALKGQRPHADTQRPPKDSVYDGNRHMPRCRSR